MIPVEILNGEVNLRKSQARMFCVYVPTDETRHLRDGEGFMSKIASSSGVSGNGLARCVNNPTFLPAVANKDPQIAGRFVRQTFEVCEGFMLKVCCSRKVGAAPFPKNGTMIVRFRAGAPVQKVRFAMVDEPEVTFNECFIQGAFDILTLEEALKFGATFPLKWREPFEQSRVDAVVKGIDVLKESVTLKPEAKQITVTNATTGEKEIKTVVAAKRRRGIAI